jgi:HlyD family secretion protein
MKLSFAHFPISWERLFWIGALLLIAAFVVYAYWPKPIEVEIATATRGPLRVLLEQEGEVRAHDRYIISAPVSGRVQRIERHAGDEVRQGEVMVVLLPLPLSALEREQQLGRLAAAEAAVTEAAQYLKQAEAEAAQAEHELLRTQDLVAKKFLSPQAAEQVRLTEFTTRAQVQATLARIKILQHESQALRSALQLQQHPGTAALSLRAPANGKILRVESDSERVVLSGTPLITLGNPQRKEIVADVLSQDAVRLRPGATVEIRQWGGTGVLSGRVRMIEPYATTKVSALGIEEKRVNVIAELEHVPAELGDGYRVEVAFILWDSAQVLKIPASAVFRRGAQWAVFVQQQGRARERLVKVGERNANEVQIVQGLEVGEQVLSYPSNQIKDGTRITPGPRRNTAARQNAA